MVDRALIYLSASRLSTTEERHYIACGAHWMHAKYLYGVWRRFTHHASNIPRKTKVNFVIRCPSNVRFWLVPTEAGRGPLGPGLTWGPARLGPGPVDLARGNLQIWDCGLGLAVGYGLGAGGIIRRVAELRIII
jgi:hypothetical protein